MDRDSKCNISFFRKSVIRFLDWIDFVVCLVFVKRTYSTKVNIVDRDDRMKEKGFKKRRYIEVNLKKRKTRFDVKYKGWRTPGTNRTSLKDFQSGLRCRIFSSFTRYKILPNYL